VESSCEFGIEPSGSMKSWEPIDGLTSSGLSGSGQLHIRGSTKDGGCIFCEKSTFTYKTKRSCNQKYYNLNLCLSPVVRGRDSETDFTLNQTGPLTVQSR
jgi:hypothetical protein